MWRRRKGRLKQRWMDSVNVDLRVMRMDVEEKERKTEAEVDGQCKCGLESDEDGCGGEEKERKTEAEVDGQCRCGLEREKGLSCKRCKTRLCGGNL